MDEAAANVAQTLAQARAWGLERIDATALLAHVLGQSRTWLVTHGEAPLAPAQKRSFDQLCTARLQGMPVAYLVGRREFYGLTLQITPAVLDPRADTEVLVDWALELLRTEFAGHPAPAVADLGAGSGAIALAIKAHCARAAVTGVERSPEALQVARANARGLGLPIEWLAGSWFEPLAERRFDLLVSNPPYIADGDPHLPALRAEPREALVAGPDGLADLRRIVTGASGHLRDGGWLLLEHGADQAEAVKRLLLDGGFDSVISRTDLAGHLRCTGGRLARAIAAR